MILGTNDLVALAGGRISVTSISKSLSTVRRLGSWDVYASVISWDFERERLPHHWARFDDPFLYARICCAASDGTRFAQSVSTLSEADLTSARDAWNGLVLRVLDADELKLERELGKVRTGAQWNGEPKFTTGPLRLSWHRTQRPLWTPGEYFSLGEISRLATRVGHSETLLRWLHERGLSALVLEMDIDPGSDTYVSRAAPGLEGTATRVVSIPLSTLLKSYADNINSVEICRRVLAEVLSVAMVDVMRAQSARPPISSAATPGSFTL